jgi:4-diphosphocytidyl-2-C-methyl-D-erythritol kinase
MEKVLRVLAPAKINLHLRVYKRRNDGFHGIRSIFQAISLADEIIVGSLKKTSSIEICGEFDCPVEKTTFYRAVLAWRAATGDDGGVKIRVGKHIPAGAGLGGGSSDAAATLRALERLSGLSLGPQRLASIGAAVGSDVPFFLLGAAALVSGRGEIVEPFAAREDFSLLLCSPGFPSSTPEAYALLDRERPDDSAEVDPEPSSLLAAYREAPGLWPFANSFEAPLMRAYPALAEVAGLLRSAGASFVRMSGSGSTVYGVFEDREAASRAAAGLSGCGPLGSSWLPAFPLACVPGLE